MNHQCRLEITDRDGWHRTFPVEKAIVYIGSDLGDDIALDRLRGSGVAPRHLQLIAPSTPGGPYRLVNLGETEIGLGAPGTPGERAIAPRSFTGIADGDTLHLGDFQLVFRADDAFQTLASPGSAAAYPQVTGAPAVEGAFGAIGLRLALSSGQLLVDRPLVGSIVVTNQGDKPGVQFRLDVEGLDAGSYEIGPGPLLFPGAEKAVPLRLVHTRAPRPAAGPRRLTIRATAPEAYPGDSAVVSQEITVMPLHAHSIKLEPVGQGVEPVGQI